jgi:penicillin-binding protein 1A
VVYSPALEKGYTEALVQADEPATFGPKTFYNDDDTYRGPITMRTALEYSINTYAVKLLDLIGVDYGYSFASKFGITTLDPNNDKNLSLALGGITNGISPLAMTAAYAAIANQGVYIKPYCVRKILDNSGGLLYEVKPQQQVAISPQTAYIMTDLLESVVQVGTGTNAQLGRPVAGKTGTTSGKADAWFIGYTPEYTAAVWTGFDKEENMENIPGVFGATYPALAWKAVMQTATEGLPVTNFPMPDGLVQVTVDNKTGLLPGTDSPAGELENDIFVQGTAPTQYSISTDNSNGAGDSTNGAGSDNGNNNDNGNTTNGTGSNGTGNTTNGSGSSTNGSGSNGTGNPTNGASSPTTGSGNSTGVATSSG